MLSASPRARSQTTLSLFNASTKSHQATAVLAGLLLRHARTAPLAALTLELQVAEPVFRLRGGDLKADRPLAVEAAIGDLQQAAGTICNHDLSCWF